jgi:hypothetical protein
MTVAGKQETSLGVKLLFIVTNMLTELARYFPPPPVLNFYPNNFHQSLSKLDAYRSDSVVTSFPATSLV